MSKYTESRWKFSGAHPMNKTKKYIIETNEFRKQMGLGQITPITRQCLDCSRDFIYLVSGTGITAGIYGITVVGTTTLTLDIAPGTDATADKVYQIVNGANFAVGTNLKAVGYPGIFPAAYTTGYQDIGAVQRQEPAAAAGLVASTALPTYRI